VDVALHVRPRAPDDRLSLDGEMDGHRIQAELRLVDRSAFPRF
jgi:hypothetical protein